MKSLSIHEPARPIPRDPGTARLLADDPREGVVPFGGSGQIGVNLLFNGPVKIGSAIFGFIAGLPDDAMAFVHAFPDGGSSTIELVGNQPVIRSRRLGLSHVYGSFSPVTVREVYLRISRLGGGTLEPNGITVGLGQVFRETFRSQWGYEWGAGRPLDDTSAVERLPGGSFAIDRGVVTSGYQWTFGDLSDDERERLYDIHRAIGRSRSVLVIEDDDRTPGLYERMHWGLLAKLDTYARVDPTATTWGMQVADWL